MACCSRRVFPPADLTVLVTSARFFRVGPSGHDCRSVVHPGRVTGGSLRGATAHAAPDAGRDGGGRWGPGGGTGSTEQAHSPLQAPTRTTPARPRNNPRPTSEPARHPPSLSAPRTHRSRAVGGDGRAVGVEGVGPSVGGRAVGMEPAWNQHGIGMEGAEPLAERGRAVGGREPLGGREVSRRHGRGREREGDGTPPRAACDRDPAAANHRPTTHSTSAHSTSAHPPWTHRRGRTAVSALAVSAPAAAPERAPASGRSRTRCAG